MAQRGASHLPPSIDELWDSHPDADQAAPGASRRPAARFPALRKYQGMASPPEPENWLMIITLGP